MTVINLQAVALLGFLGSWSSFSGWEWTEIGAAALVAVGCIGEMYWLFVKGPKKEEWIKHEEFERKRTNRERLFAIIVAIGVTVELLQLPHGLRESANLMSTNLVLRSNVAVLEAKVRPRSIDPEARTKLLSRLRRAPKGPVMVLANFADNESELFSDAISSVLVEAGFEKREAGPIQILSLRRFGVVMFVRDPTNAPPHASEIQRTFNDTNLFANVFIDGRSARQGGTEIEKLFAGTNSNLVLIWVAQKP
jgi:hypothetical protein